MSVRIVVCVDLESENPCEAYKALWQAMGSIEDAPGVEGWESTDEWFDSDGETMTPEQCQEVREKHFSDECGDTKEQRKEEATGT